MELVGLNLKMISINLNSIDDTNKFAFDFSKKLSVGSVVCLSGDLGSGKTTFCKALINSLIGKDIDVVSPTFNLLNIYNSDKFDIYHYDFYRLNAADEVFNLDIDYAFDNAITLIEWPDIANDIINRLAKKRFDLFFSFDGTSRILSFSN